MKRVWAVLLAVMVLMSSVPMVAAEPTEDGAHTTLDAVLDYIDNHTTVTENPDGTRTVTLDPVMGGNYRSYAQVAHATVTQPPAAGGTFSGDYGYGEDNQHTSIALEQRFLYSLLDEEYQAYYRQLDMVARGLEERAEFMGYANLISNGTLYFLYMFDTPELFYLGNTVTLRSTIIGYDYVMCYAASSTEYCCYGHDPCVITDELRAKILSKKALFDAAAEDFIATIPADAPDLIKERLIYAKILRASYYNLSAQWKGIAEDNWTAYGIMVNGYGVCESYSEAFQTLCNAVGIPCTGVIGYAGGPHKWNAVNIDGEWYQCDVTFDDPIGGDPNEAYSNYFNLTDAQMASCDHDWSGCDFEVPACSATENGRENFRSFYGEDEDGVIHAFTGACDTQCDNCRFERAASAEHTYQSACDEHCDVCGYARGVDHIYDSRCDAVCNVCGYERFIYSEHYFASECDSRCRECGYERVPSAEHVYDNVCDTVCNDCGQAREGEHLYVSACDEKCEFCGHERETTAAHAYDNACDEKCNACGYERDVTHVYASGCDEFCDVCGYERQPLWSHHYIHGCDTECDVCGFMRETTHVYGSGCDEFCDECGFRRVPSALHTYDDACDEMCDDCGQYRAIEHTYASGCDESCDVCGYDRGVAAPHAYDNTCDTVCNLCEHRRAIEHTYASGCDESCDVCGDRRHAPAEHVYDNPCDACCNVCGHERYAADNHVYDNACDAVCDVCGETRAVEPHTLWAGYFVDGHEHWRECSVCYAKQEVAVHGYDNACDTTCDVCGYEREIVHTYAGDCDVSCDVCGDIRLITLDHRYTNDCDAVCNACGFIRTVGEHTYTGAYSTACDECGFPRALQSVFVSQLPYKVTYRIGEPLDTTGLALALLYDNGDVEVTAEALSVYGFDSVNVGTKTLTVVCAGKMVTITVTVVAPKNGWERESGRWVFYVDGARVTSEWRRDSKGWVYLDASGYMLTNAWVRDSVGWCYVGADGYAVTNCWKKDSVGWCYLNGNGSMTKNAWVKDGGKWYFLDANGYMLANRWKKDSKGWVYLGSSGAMLTNAWVRDSVGWCYVGSDGYAVTNCWKRDSVGWCYLNGNGSMVKNNWVPDGGKWYYLDGNGYMVANGSCVWKGTTYYFDASGVCLNP